MRLRSDSFERKKEATRNAEIRVATKETRGNKFGISHVRELDSFSSPRTNIAYACALS